MPTRHLAPAGFEGLKDLVPPQMWQQLACRVGDWRQVHLDGLSITGTIGGLVGYSAAYSPSLVPRSWGFQGFIAALSAMFGYQVGMLFSWMAGLMADLLGIRALTRRTGTRIWVATALVSLAAAIIGVPIASLRTQRRTARYCHVQGPGAGWAAASTAAATAMLALFAAQWRLTVASIDWVTKHVRNRVTWALLARMLSTLIVLGTIVMIFDQVILRSVIEVGRSASERLDRTTPSGLTQPLQFGRSGSVGSHERWENLGLQGKRFVTGSPDARRISEVTGAPALDPLRAYAALNGRSLEQTVAAVLDEMDRVGAWQRSHIFLVTTTGRGNANEWSASACEFLTGGDCCTVAMQYSGLPSAITLFTGKEVPVEASRLLYTEIRDHCARMPDDQRPRLYLAGESLGAYGSNGIFDTPEQMVDGIDGALWLGTPDFTPMHQLFAQSRKAGSTIVDPVIDDGRHVRFGRTRAMLSVTEQGETLGSWDHPRIVYLQNDTDPVVWWSTKLLWSKPEWLREQHAPDSPMAQMTWLPFVTFWQLASDMPVCRNVPEGFGHKYHANQIVPAWAGVLGRDVDGDYERIIDALIHDIGTTL